MIIFIDKIIKSVQGKYRVIMNQLSHLIYVSSATELIPEENLSDLLSHARSKNTEHNITGMLLYHDGSIMQVIEGQTGDVDQLLTNLQSDPRHKGLIVLLKEPIDSRFFSEWSMSYKNISGNIVDGFSDFLLSGSLAENNKFLVSKAKNLLLNFRG